MKQLLRPQIVIVGTAVLALLGWTTASAATGSFGDRHSGSHEASVLAQQAGETPEASPSPEAEATNEPAEPAENQPAQPAENQPAEPAENEPAQPAENEPAEPAENQNETPAPAPASAPTTSASRTFQLIGGTASFTCTGNAISLDSAVPAAGFSVETENEDGGIQVRFESDSHRSEIRAGCSGGQVVAGEIREESD